MADNFTLRVRSGDTFAATVTYTDSDGNPIDLTGYTFAFHVSVGAISNTYTGTPQITFSGATIAITLSSTLTAAYITAAGRFYLRLTSPAGVVTTLLMGAIEVEFVK